MVKATTPPQSAPQQAQKPKMNEGESPLYRLYFRKDAHGKSHISREQFQAGERLRTDYELAHMERRITASWEEKTGSNRYKSLSDNWVSALTDNAIDARKRLFNAFDEVGAELSGVLYHVCCLAAGLEQAERRLEIPQRSGKAILALGLTRLARHYKLLAPAGEKTTSGPLSHWAMHDYRPQIMPPEQRAQPL